MRECAQIGLHALSVDVIDGKQHLERHVVRFTWTDVDLPLWVLKRKSYHAGCQRDVWRVAEESFGEAVEEVEGSVSGGGAGKHLAL